MLSNKLEIVKLEDLPIGGRKKDALSKTMVYADATITVPNTQHGNWIMINFDNLLVGIQNSSEEIRMAIAEACKGIVEEPSFEEEIELSEMVLDEGAIVAEEENFEDIVEVEPIEEVELEEVVDVSETSLEINTFSLDELKEFCKENEIEGVDYRWRDKSKYVEAIEGSVE